jgi:predicted MPP superfamily phosphohydrolase
VWGWFEAGWVRLEELEVGIAKLPPELSGLRIAHLSDFHLGVPSRGRRAAERAVAWVAERRPDLVCITGDLLTRSKGEPLLRRLAAELPQPTFAILGNHDFAISRDPFSDRTPLGDLDPVRILSDEGETVELRGRRVYVAGADPRSRWAKSRRQPADLAVSRDEADLRILLVHYPRLVDQVPPGAFDLVLAGHLHDGQINLPYPGGKLSLAHVGARFSRGIYRVPAGTLHVSAGLGTTFVPFRFAARPEATELVLQRE